MGKKNKKILKAEPVSVEVTKTKGQWLKDFLLFILKNPKTVLEWMLVFLVGKLIFSGELTFETIKKFIK